jgi:ankyrin repeat protein
LAASIPQQQAVAGQDTTSAPTSFPQQQQQATTHPFFWNLPNPLGIPPSGIEAIYQADESNYQAQPALHHDSDDEDADNPGSGRMLLRLVEDHHWVASLQRIATHPRETQQVGIQGRTPLHVACDHDAPPALVQALLNAWPEGAERVGTSQMNPLHITCSSPHACVDVVRVLLGGSRDSVLISGAKDVDGDTPLHAACRCAAPMDVLVTLLHANPITVTWKDYEGLNPLFRLWVRYFVLVGEQIISNIKRPEDIKGDLVEAWEKSLLLLRIMSDMEQQSRVGQMDGQDATSFRVVHAASSVDCPRCVVRIAKVLFPRDLMVRDEKNRLPIHIAAAAPVYAVHDLRGEGFTLDDVDFDEDPETRAARMKNKECKYKEPSVIDILLSGDPKAAKERDPRGQLPLHVAIMRGKTLEEGVQALVEAHPDALTTPDSQTDLYPFMLAASVGRGRGDCSTIYGLLRAAPELVHMALTGEPRVEVDDRKPAAVAVVIESSDS